MMIAEEMRSVWSCCVVDLLLLKTTSRILENADAADSFRNLVIVEEGFCEGVVVDAIGAFLI